MRLIIFVLLFAPFLAAAETAYVTDNLRLGLHAAEDTSDRAFRFLESGQAMDGSDSIYMDVWALTAAVRGYSEGGTELWLHGGLAGTSSNNFEGLRGAVMGMKLTHALNRTLAIGGGARYFLLQEGMRARELKVAISASYLSLGYRVFGFNVGEPLHGPELGLAMSF